MNKKQLGNRIHDTRIMRDITLDQLASAVGVNKSTISRYERGEIEAPRLPVIDAIANALCVNPAWLVGKSDDKTFTPSRMDLASYSPCNLFSALRSIRESLGITAADAAFRIGISTDDYLAIENGRDTSCLVLARIATLFCCSTDYILSFDGFLGETRESRPISLSLTSASNSGCEVVNTEEAELLRKFRCLDARGQAAVLNVLEHEYASLPGDKTAPAPKEA